ncbi:MAG: hypothetical protein WBQ95_10780 [Terracidiphilus sp.]
MNLKITPPSGNQQGQYCILIYRAPGSGFVPSGGETPILLALLSPDGELSFFVKPRWFDIVAHEDQHYFRSLMEDIAARSKFEPRELFQQVASLEVGPLIARDVGPWKTREDAVKALQAEFEWLT